MRTLAIAMLLLCITARAAVVPVLDCPGGNYDWARAAWSPSLDVSGKITMEAWVRPTAWRPKNVSFIVSKGLIGSTWCWTMLLNNGRLQYNDKYGDRHTEAIVPLNVWTHVAITVDGPADRMTFFVDGVAVLTTNALAVTTGMYDVYVGGHDPRNLGWLTYHNNEFIGQITEVRIWKTVRTPAQILSTRNTRLSGSDSGLVAYWPITTIEDASGHGNGLTLSGQATIKNSSTVPVETGPTTSTTTTTTTQPASTTTTTQQPDVETEATLQFHSDGTVTGTWRGKVPAVNPQPYEHGQWMHIITNGYRTVTNVPCFFQAEVKL